VSTGAGAVHFLVTAHWSRWSSGLEYALNAVGSSEPIVHLSKRIASLRDCDAAMKVKIKSHQTLALTLLKNMVK